MNEELTTEGLIRQFMFNEAGIKIPFKIKRFYVDKGEVQVEYKHVNNRGIVNNGSLSTKYLSIPLLNYTTFVANFNRTLTH